MASRKGSHGRRRDPGTLRNSQRRQARLRHQGRHRRSSLEHDAEMARTCPALHNRDLHRRHRPRRAKDRGENVDIRMPLAVLPESKVRSTSLFQSGENNRDYMSLIESVRNQTQDEVEGSQKRRYRNKWTNERIGAVFLLYVVTAIAIRAQTLTTL